MQWEETGSLPLVWADRYGLMQVFLNLAKNSIRAMERAETRRLTIGACVEPEHVTVSFEDTGKGMANPHSLFRPFQHDRRHRSGPVRLAGPGEELRRRSGLPAPRARLLL